MAQFSEVGVWCVWIGVILVLELTVPRIVRWLQSRPSSSHERGAETAAIRDRSTTRTDVPLPEGISQGLAQEIAS